MKKEQIKLDEQQTKAVNATESKVIVVAPAGSGKTTVITERVKTLLNRGANPNAIVVITFTTQAALELKDRLKDVPNANKCFIGTIHAYARYILRMGNYEFDILDDDNQNLMMKALFRSQKTIATYEDYEYLMKLEAQNRIGKIKKNDIPSKFSSYRVYKDLMILMNRDTSAHSYKFTLRDICHNNNIITFEELIEYATQYFNDIGFNIENLLVDEHQDVSETVFKFLMELNAQNNFFIGDYRQAIYGFNGGSVDIFLSLINNPNWTTYELTRNYRCSNAVIDVSNEIIKRVFPNDTTVIQAVRDVEGSFKMVSSMLIENYIAELKANNQLDDWFIITRSNKEILKIVAILKKLEIEHVVVRRAKDGTLGNALKHNGIKVMTAHGSKGLEEKNVMVFGHFPFNPKKKTEDEEVRLLYVASTRARDNLVFCM